MTDKELILQIVIHSVSNGEDDPRRILKIATKVARYLRGQGLVDKDSTLPEEERE